MKASPACYSPGSHPHLTTADLYGPRPLSSYPHAEIYDLRSSHIKQSFVGEGGQLDLGLVKWFSFPKVLRVAYQPAVLTGELVRGLSARAGEYLAAAFQKEKAHQDFFGWAHMMVEEMRPRLPHPCSLAAPAPGYTKLHRLRPD